MIMLMSPAVNALTSASDCRHERIRRRLLRGGGSRGRRQRCQLQSRRDLLLDRSRSERGEQLRSHRGDVGASVPATFLHELQHLISYSQHVVVHGGTPEYGWLDEGMSIVAEELGSVYYEQKCPGTACRTDPTQLFPDSSQGFIQGFLYDSYQYALLPDTASVTLHRRLGGRVLRGAAATGCSCAGSATRWVRLLQKLEQSTLTGVANIQAASGQSFPALFANFGLALFTDSLPGLRALDGARGGPVHDSQHASDLGAVVCDFGQYDDPSSVSNRDRRDDRRHDKPHDGPRHERIFSTRYAPGHRDCLRPIRRAGCCCAVVSSEAAACDLQAAAGTVGAPSIPQRGLSRLLNGAGRQLAEATASAPAN